MRRKGVLVPEKCKTYEVFFFFFDWKVFDWSVFFLSGICTFLYKRALGVEVLRRGAKAKWGQRVQVPKVNGLSWEDLLWQKNGIEHQGFLTSCTQRMTQAIATTILVRSPPACYIFPTQRQLGKYENCIGKKAIAFFTEFPICWKVSSWF